MEGAVQSGTASKVQSGGCRAVRHGRCRAAAERYGIEGAECGCGRMQALGRKDGQKDSEYQEGRNETYDTVPYGGGLRRNLYRK